MSAVHTKLKDGSLVKMTRKEWLEDELDRAIKSRARLADDITKIMEELDKELVKEEKKNAQPPGP